LKQTFRADLLALQNDSSGRQIMVRRLELVHEIIYDDSFGGVDINTPEGYQQLIECKKPEAQLRFRLFTFNQNNSLPATVSPLH
jgi:hypothetical protein